MPKILILFLLNLFPALTLLSQINGRIVDINTNSGLEGANIVSENGEATSSGKDGYFQISGTGLQKKLTISFIGYETRSFEFSESDSILLFALRPLTQNIDEVLITATGFPTEMLRSTASITAITGDKFDSHANIVLNDLINQVPGVYMSGGTYSTNRITIRGIGSRSPYASNRIRASFDDIPLTTGDGSTSIEDIDMSFIGRAEVLKGPSSAVYGSGMGGSIRMYPVNPEKKGLSMQAGLETASFGSNRLFARAGYKNDKEEILLSFARAHSEGYRQNNTYNRNSLFVKGSEYFRKSTLSFTLLYTGLEAGIPSSLSKADFVNTPAIAAPTWLAVKGFEQYQKIVSGVNYEFRLNKKMSSKTLLFGVYNDPFESRPFNILDESSFSSGIREQFQFSFKYLKIIAGGEVFNEKYSSKIFRTLMGIQDSLQAYNRESRFYFNTFALGKAVLFERLTIEAGLNANHLSYSLRDVFNADTTDYSGSHTYKLVVSPRLALNYSLSPGLNIHASAGHGFSAPSAEETLLPDGQVNKNLKPETGINYEAGLRGILLKKYVEFDLSLYHIDLRNLLVTKRISDEIFYGVNAGRTSHSGIELLLKINALPDTKKEIAEVSFTTGIFTSLNRFRDFTDNGVNYTGNKLPGIPASSVNAEFRAVKSQKLEMILTYQYTGRQFLDDANSGIYNGWQTLNIYSSYSIKSLHGKLNAKIYGGVRNIFNEKYAGMILVNASSFGASLPRYYYPGLPRNFYAGLSLEF